MLLASAVVVWEWLNEHGRWRPYSPAVSHHIEAVVRAGPRAGGSVVLGQVDGRLAPYIIDLHSMNQFRQDTGEPPSGPRAARRRAPRGPGAQRRPSVRGPAAAQLVTGSGLCKPAPAPRPRTPSQPRRPRLFRGETLGLPLAGRPALLPSGLPPACPPQPRRLRRAPGWERARKKASPEAPAAFQRGKAASLGLRGTAAPGCRGIPRASVRALRPPKQQARADGERRGRDGAGNARQAGRSLCPWRRRRRRRIPSEKLSPSVFVNPEPDEGRWLPDLYTVFP